MPIIELTGNIFTTKCQTIVNTVNCVGVMGSGIAYECRLRYPEMFKQYVKHCEAGRLDIGMLWLYKSNAKWILNFPTKKHWKYPSKPEYLKSGLQKFIDCYKEKGITSIAFPLLGADKGKLEESLALELMKNYLDKCNIEIEIYHYSPNAIDDLFEAFKQQFLDLSEQELKARSGVRADRIRIIKSALSNDTPRSLSQLATIKGIGDITLEKIFHFCMQEENPSKQESLFTPATAQTAPRYPPRQI